MKTLRLETRKTSDTVIVTAKARGCKTFVSLYAIQSADRFVQGDQIFESPEHCTAHTAKVFSENNPSKG